MLRVGGRRRRRLPVNAEINLTNLIDVAFVLLIIFMITAPILQGGIEVALPQADAAPITTSDALVVSVARNGDVFVEKVKVASLDEFENVFRTYATGEKRKQVTLKGDRAVPFGAVVDVLGRMVRMDIADVGLAVEPRN
ncbi:MAG TPA: biopolymer transporter ExbD [Solirubrobacteraceae bacterium]|nr:biopolymer transporter ExbD [Solirubrobacteraceae bacterium]